MSSQEQFSQSSGPPPVRSTGTRKPVCPHCEQRMVVRTVVPVLFAGSLDDVTYACEGCGVEVKRTVKRD